MTPDERKITIRLDAALHRRFRLLSIEKGESMNELLVKWIGMYLERFEKEKV